MSGKYFDNAFAVVVFAVNAGKPSYQLRKIEGKGICIS